MEQDLLYVFPILLLERRWVEKHCRVTLHGRHSKAQTQQNAQLLHANRPTRHGDCLDCLYLFLQPGNKDLLLTHASVNSYS